MIDKKKLLRRRKIYRILSRKEKRPDPLFSRNDYCKYDWMLINILFNDETTVSSNRMKQILSGKFPNVKRYLETRYDDSSSVNESLHRIKNHLEIRPTCPVCGNKVQYLGNGKYSVCCSSRCSANYDVVTRKKRQTSLDRYGVEHPSQSTIVKEHVKQTCLERYGVEYFCNTDKVRNSCKEKYGVRYPFQSKKILDKCKETCLERYGVEIYSQLEECKEKIHKTCMEKYGVSSWSKTEDFKKMMQDNKDKINEKRTHTKEKNGTLSTSYEEQNLYKEIVKNYPDALTQYKSDEYPFLCDFYIPSEHLYIEYQGYPSHGEKPYENSDQDNKVVDEWKCKKYEGWIYDWTKRDVMKRNCAKKHGLRWIEIFYYDPDFLMNTINRYISEGNRSQLSIYKAK